MLPKRPWQRGSWVRHSCVGECFQNEVEVEVEVERKRKVAAEWCWRVALERNGSRNGEERGINLQRTITYIL